MTASNAVLGIAGILFGALLGALAVSAHGSRRSASDKARIAELGAELQGLERRRADEASLLESSIQRISAEMVLQGSDRLAKEAGERFAEALGHVSKDLDLREERFKRQVDPIAALLGQYKEQLGALELSREGAYRSVTEQIEMLKLSGESLRKETASLVTALRRPTTRGRWGEMQLRRVVEMAGMIEHCDFIEQATTETDGAITRPDLLVTMPGGGLVVVDAKAPLSAYLDALDAEDETSRRDRLVQHARQLAVHVDALSRKAYWNQFDGTPDFVVCFVPGDALLAAAFEADPDLVERAMSSRVLLCGPTNLIALLRTVGFGWRQEAMADNARTVQSLGAELYDRLVVMAGHLDKLGRSLDRSVSSFNDLVGSAESRVLVTARRFQDLGVVGDGAREVPLTSVIDISARRIQAPELLGAEDDDEREENSR